MREAVIKFILSLGFIVLALTGRANAQSKASKEEAIPPVYFVNTSYEEELLKTAGIKVGGSLIESGWYHSRDGIDKTAQKFVKKLPDDADVVLYGISMGGVVTRRMAQVAEENGKNVVGYIAQSSPLNGERLTNKGWALTAAGMLGGYAVVGTSFSMLTFWTELLSCWMGPNSKSVFAAQISLSEEYDDELVKILEKLTEVTSRDISEVSSEEIISQISIPLFEMLLGRKNRGGEDFLFVPDVLGNYKNNVKDLDPTGDFMTNVMNNPSEMKKELLRNKKTVLENGNVTTAPENMKRAFIVSTNGDLFETSEWGKFEGAMTNLIKQRDTYWAMACSQWWLFPVWSLKSAAMNIPIATIEGIPKVWSNCLTGFSDLTS